MSRNHSNIGSKRDYGMDMPYQLKRGIQDGIYILILEIELT